MAMRVAAVFSLALGMFLSGLPSAQAQIPDLNVLGTNPDPLRDSAMRARPSSPFDPRFASLRSARVLGVEELQVDWNSRRRVLDPPSFGVWPALADTLPSASTTTGTSSLDLADSLVDINRRRIRLTKYGMGTLLTWAVGNIAVGVAGNIAADDKRIQAFHQGNWGWNVVNLIIGGIGLYNAVTADPAELDYQKTNDAIEGLRLAFVINSVIDCVYISTGAWLWERGLRTDEPVMTGWGQALVLQGGFLLAFDIVMWVLTLDLKYDIDAIPVRLVPTTDGMALVGRF